MRNGNSGSNQLAVLRRRCDPKRSIVRRPPPSGIFIELPDGRLKPLREMTIEEILLQARRRTT
jgi:hypothetical protein